MKNKSFPLATFLTSAALLKQLPADTGAEIAFAGRSNAGKSSAINVITGKKGLARASKTPGRTQLINFFSLNTSEDAQHRLVDLPGYGYAKVSAVTKIRWQKTLAQYLEARQSLTCLILVSDIRHPLKEYDQQMVDWATARNLPLHMLLTKADKLSRSVAMRTLLQVQKTLQDNPNVTCQLFSSHNHMGLEQARKHILQSLGI